ncbi:MAG: glycosyltransferase family 4 protein [Rhodospirillales bacterium]|nr:glycosyltransferase family 4 protein [Rhodospirillales bacterium]
MPPAAPAKLSPLHRLWRTLPAERRRLLFAQATAALAPRPTRPAPPARGGIAVVGELSRASGLGEAARLMRTALDGMGVPNWGLDVGDRLPGGTAGLRQIAPPPAGAPLLVHVNAPTLPWALMRLPRGTVRGRRIIGYWAWELPSVPATWRPALRLVHEIWVLSRFTGDAIATLLPKGSDIALRVVPIPIAVAPPRPSGMDRAAFGLPAEAVVVLVSFNLASSFTRKNPLAAIAAFRQAFGGRADRILVLKAGNTEHFPADLALLRAAAGDAANIRIETRTLPAADSHALTQCADIVMSLHRSEGFGLVPAEAMLLGRPVVATGWSGNMEFMDEASAALVGYRLVPARDERGVFEAPGAVWAEPDIGEAAAHLARLADDAGAREALGRRGQAMARARLGDGALRAAVAALGLPMSSGAQG